jgi:hypothetical protein
MTENTDDNIQTADNEEISSESGISWEIISPYNPEENNTEKSDNEPDEIQSDDNNIVSSTENSDYEVDSTDNNDETDEDEKSDSEPEKKKFSFKNLFKRKKK